jgi:hypothetical protein
LSVKLITPHRKRNYDTLALMKLVIVMQLRYDAKNMLTYHFWYATIKLTLGGGHNERKEDEITNR